MTSVSSDRRQGVNGTASIKVPVVAASTGNLTLSAEQTVDGIALVTDDRVFCKDQTDTTENGIYYVNSSSWTRAPDFDGQFDVVEGSIIPVNRGTANSDTYWKVTNIGTITIGTTALTFQATTVLSSAIINDGSVKMIADFSPNVDITYDIGTALLQWVHGFFSGTITAAKGIFSDTTDATSATAAAVKNAGGEAIAKTAWIGQDIVLDERADHAATSAAGNGIVWLKSDAPNRLFFTDDTAVDRKIVTADTAVANHIRAGNTQLTDGASSTTTLVASTVVTEVTWESIGPTGSGADNIWTAMDVIPANSTVLIVDVVSSMISSSSTIAIMSVYVTYGDDATPNAEATNKFVYFAFDPDAASEQGLVTNRIFIPLGPTSQDFQLYWDVENATSPSVTLIYKGFMTD